METTTKITLPLWQTIVLWLCFVFTVVLGVLELVAGGYSTLQDLSVPIDPTIVVYQAVFRLSPDIAKIIGGVLLILKMRATVMVLIIAFGAYVINFFLLQIYSIMIFGESMDKALSMLSINLFFIIYSIVYIGVLAFVWLLHKQGKLG